MKKYYVLNLLALAMLLAIMPSCSEPLNGTVDDQSLTVKSANLATAGNPTCNFNSVLTQAEIDGLLQMREEEKVARDVYLTFSGLYKAPVFSNIAKSEQAHMDAILNLIKGYGLTDPAYTEVGKFTPAFQNLYDQLVKDGKASLKAALEVGVKIEVMDIADLEQHISETKVPNILQVYKNLLAGSKNHLSAFNFNLSKQ
jgi:hypothetical protein